MPQSTKHTVIDPLEVYIEVDGGKLDSTEYDFPARGDSDPSSNGERVCCVA